MAERRHSNRRGESRKTMKKILSQEEGGVFRDRVSHSARPLGLIEKVRNGKGWK